MEATNEHRLVGAEAPLSPEGVDVPTSGAPAPSAVCGGAVDQEASAPFGGEGLGPRAAGSAVNEGAEAKLKLDETIDLTGIGAVDAAAALGVETRPTDYAFVEPGSEEGPDRVADPPRPLLDRHGYRFCKRVFDITFSGAVIVVGIVPAVLLCAAIRLESPGNPIYVQRRIARITRGGEVRTFPMFKFRSMYKDADKRLEELRELNEADGPLFKIKDDPRVTRIGRFIRKHSIDEFPQFLNVFAGQLSVVGPRPALPREVDQYGARAMQRLRVKPGLTCYWQTRGRSDTGFDEMVDLDLQYIKERGFLTDLKCILDTVRVVINGEGAC